MKQRGPRFDILAGSSLDELSRVKVNADRSGPLAIKTKSFEGNLTVRMKDFADYNGDIYRDTETNYFANWTDVTWSIQIQGQSTACPSESSKQIDVVTRLNIADELSLALENTVLGGTLGRFLQPTSADDCVFGNTFDKPIRDRLPFGTGAALKAISYIDPSLENDLYADKPWAWSPLLATMNYIRTERLDADDSPLPPCEAATRPVEDCSSLLSGNPTNISKPHLRRKFFSSAVNRQAIMLGPRDFVRSFLSSHSITIVLLASSRTSQMQMVLFMMRPIVGQPFGDH
ncbi:hypothetical protein PGTUg99_026933 [Puccinia graminis f. sp. tritici]|uniref:Domain of unknown function at the cortex 1 domain-containing protein n=1 Tax=Puccinia graminis f. sp. tritici TaxID=56615 RepID=A0A5B0RT46_PUCGR|nr:hypothetical protein PGTUg99_026933 [Puccinia graminis f. sp. tritici]